MTDDPDGKESIDTPLEIFLDNYTYLGEDSEGYHHHADKKHTRIIVCSDPGRRVNDGWHVCLDPDEIDHVHEDDCFRYADGLEDWADHVADARGWTDRQLYTAPGLRAAFHSGDDHLLGDA